jgi:ribosome-associated protein
MPRRPAPHRGLDVHYGDPTDGAGPDTAPARPSRTQLKRHAESLQALGAQIAALPADRRAKAPMPEALRDAIETYVRTRSHEGRRRQLQYVGRLMQQADEAALREALAAATIGSARAALELHELERWREALIDDEAALGRFIHTHPGTDTQHLASLVRAARRDRVPDAAPGVALRQPRSHRELFRYLKANLGPIHAEGAEATGAEHE